MCRILVALVGLIVLVTAATWAAEPPSQDDFLKEWASGLEKIQSLKQTQLLKIHFEMSGIKQQTEMPLSVIFRRPDRLSLQTQFATIVCDGTNVYVRIPMSGKYMVSEQKPDSIETMIQNQQFVYSQLFPDIKALLSKDPLTALKEAFRNSPPEILPDEKIGDREYRVVRYVSEEAAMLPNMKKGLKLWIDREYGLIHRAESFSLPTQTTDEPKDEDESRIKEMMEKMSLALETTQQTVNESLPDTEFVFTPNPRDKKVETSIGLWGSGAGGEKGFSRFALSGKAAPDFKLTLLDGSEFRLSAYTGSVVLIDFWATWCGPCVRALPEMRKLHELYGTNGVMVVGISRDRNDQKEKVQSTLEKHGITYPVGIDDVGNIASSYYVEGIPCLVLINREGIVQGRKVGFSGGALDALRKDIDDVLAGKEIAGAKPLTEAELKDLEEERTRQKQWSARSVALDTNLFRCVWRSPSSRRSSDSFFSAIVAIPPLYCVIRQDTELFVLSVTDGQTNAVFEVPEKTADTSSSRHAPTYYFLRNSTGGVLAAVEKRYKASEDEPNSYVGDRLEVYGMAPDGSVTWTQSLDRSWHSSSAWVLPWSKSADALLLAAHDRVMIISAQGENLLTQRTDYGDRFVFFADSQGKTMVFAERNDHVGLYELVVPTK